MTQQRDQNTDIDARLADFGARTANVGPRPGFSAKVMDRVRQESPGTLFELRLPALRFFPVGVLAAALALVWAVSANNAVNEALAVSYDDVEVGW